MFKDAQESLIWLLDSIHEELKEDHLIHLSNSSSKVIFFYILAKHFLAF